MIAATCSKPQIVCTVPLAPQVQLRQPGIAKAYSFSSNSTKTRAFDRVRTQVAKVDYHPIIPPQIEEVEDEAALDMARRIEVVSLNVPSVGATVQTAYVGPDLTPAQLAAKPVMPVVLLHGFDSSLLEFRRLWPLLDQAGVPAYAVDLVGWGFSDAGFHEDPDLKVGPKQKRDHLYAFWKEKIGVPMVVLGFSLGGAIAMDFALEHPDAVGKLVLMAPQVYVDGLGPMASMPRFISRLGVEVLRSVPLRSMASYMAYKDKAKFATEDATRIGRLHTHLPGWANANIAFMASGGYSMSGKVTQVTQPTLLLWGRQDEILETSQAARIAKDVPNCKLEWLDDCGHFGCLEQAPGVVEHMIPFIKKD